MEDSTPILIGVGQYTEKGIPPTKAQSPMGLAAIAAHRALLDAGLTSSQYGEIDAVVVTRIFPDSFKDRTRVANPFGRAENPPWAVAKRLGIKPAVAIYGNVGGNTPQKTVNEMAQRISQGEVEAVVLTGSEAINTARAALRTGITLDWHEQDSNDFEDRGIGEPMSTAHEIAHGLTSPISVYPLFENAIRGIKGHTVEQHLRYMGELFAPFTEVAANNPFSFYGSRRSAQELATLSAENRYISFPYPKWMNAMDSVNQAASVVMTSVGKAKTLGIDPSKWVFLHGCAEASDKIMVSERVNYFSSPAMKLNSQRALHMAGIGIDAIEYLDIYSCFPSAVEVACEALGIDAEDERGLTLTGGLPFFGGPGNNYSMHAIATLVPLLRQSRNKYGLISANGGRLTKHATGIYSCQAIATDWCRENPSNYQSQIDAQESPKFTEQPSGPAAIETYTVTFDREGPVLGIVVGRLDDGTRFIANTPSDESTLQEFIHEEQLGRKGMVNSENGKNTFIPNT